MIIITFVRHTSKILPRLFCRRFRHCAVIMPGDNGGLTMYQFVARRHIVRIRLCPRDIRILRAHGWRMVYVSTGRMPCPPDWRRAWTCVDMAKRAAGIHAPWVQTPWALYTYLRRHHTQS